MQNEWTSPSGSRWEPLPQPAAAVPGNPTPDGGASAQVVASDAGPHRRRRRPVVAVLLTLLGAGAVTGGAAYAYETGSPAASTRQPTSQVARAGDRTGRHEHGVDGDHPEGGYRRDRTGQDNPGTPSGASS